MPTIALSRPAQGQAVTVRATDQNAKIALDFSTDGVTLSRDDSSLIFTFEDGSAIRIDDFYSNYHAENIPDFEIAGKLVSGTEFFKALGPDLVPAAGPASVERSSHYTEHDNADLASGIDHLGSLDYRTENSALYDGSLLMGGAEIAAAPPAAGDTSGQGASSTYHTRLIVTATSANTFSFFAVDQDGNIVSDATKISNLGFEGANTYFIITGLAPDGRITVELTAAGLAALNNGTLASDMLLISVDGVEYKMPLLITGGSAGQSYDAAAEESRAQIGNDLKAEWYASDSRVVSSEQITLGGSSYNRVDIDSSEADGAPKMGVHNSAIDITASARGDVNISALSTNGNAHGLATYGNAGHAASSVRGGNESTIHVSATTTGNLGTAWGVYTSSAEGATAESLLEARDITVEAHGNMAGSGGVYTWAGGGRPALTTIQADRDLTIIADSQQDSAVRGAFATGSGAAIILSAGPEGRLQVSSHLESSSQEHFNTEKGGSFVTLALSSYNGGTITATGSDINIDAGIGSSSAHGTAAGVYAGYGNAKTTINAHNGQTNSINIHADAPDHAHGVIGTNSGTVAINGGDGNDTVSISSEASYGSSIGVAAQYQGQVRITGNGGHDELNIDATFNGPAKSGTTELFDGSRGAYGMASAWGGSWVKVEGFEKVNVTADARGGNGAAYGMYTRDGWGESVGNSIKYTDGSLHATISGQADDPSKGHSMYSYTGVNSIQGGSKLGDADGDRITLNGHMTIVGNSGKNLVTTGDGDDIVRLNGNMQAASNGTLNKIETGLGNDVVRVSGEMNASNAAGANAIHAGAGDNEIELGGGMRGVGNNTITVGSGSSTITLGGAMSASGASGVNTIQGDVSGNTVVNVNGQGAALYATAGGKNSISAVHDVHVDSGYIYATGSGSSNKITDIAGEVTTTMLAAGDGGRNDVTNVGSLDILATGSGSMGVYAGQNATNNVEVNGGIDISAQSTSDGTWGLIAGSLGGNATNSLKAGGDINITATGNGTSANAIDNNSGNTTHVESTGGDVTLKATSTSNGVQGIWGIGSTTVTAGKNLTIETSTQGAAEARGVHTGGTTTLTAQDGDVTIRAEGDTASGLYTASTGTTTVSASGLVDIQAHGKSGSYYIHGGNATALYAESQNSGQLARNIIEGGEVSITAKTLQNGDTYALYSKAALNTVTSDTQATVTAKNDGSGNAWGMYATSTNNKLGANEITGHDVKVSSSAANGNAYAMQASSTTGDSSNTVTLTGGNADISATSDQGSAYAVQAEGRGSNKVTLAGGNADISATSTQGYYAYAMYASGSGSNNDVTTTGDGDVNITAKAQGFSYGMLAKGSGSSNAVTADSGNVTVTAIGEDDGHGMSAQSGSNTITTGSGDVTVTGTGTGMMANGSGSSNTIATGSGDVAVNGGIDPAMTARAGGSNTITTDSGDVTVGTATSHNYGMYTEGSSGSNRITTSSGNVSVSGSAAMFSTVPGSNSITTDSGDVKVSGTDGYGYGMYAAGGSNSITTESGNVTVSGTGTGTGGYGYGMHVEMTADNTITTGSGEVNVSGSGAAGGYGMAATGSGVNTVESTAVSPLTVTITATADIADKAIAMWAEGGGSVNYITGHSQTGGTGDSITLTANNGQGIAMQAENGGQNIITTGAGDDSVTINGKIVGDGNEINLGGGSNTLILNGAVQPGSLNVIASGGTYTLILQAADTQGFITQYGDWLNALGSSDLIANGLSSISFDGLDPSALPADFLSEFNDLLWALNLSGTVSIEPSDLVTHLQPPVAPTAAPLSALLAETGAEHHAQDAQHAAGPDDTLDSPLAAHHDPALMTDHMTGDDPAITFSAQPNHAAAHADTPGADAHAADAAAAACISEDEEGQVQPLFALLTAPATGTSADTPANMFEEGDDGLHNGYLDTEMDEGSDLAELHASITLAHGDENLDSLFAAMNMQDAEQDEADLFGGTELHGMGLTDMNEVLDQSHLAGPAANGSPAAVADTATTTEATASIPVTSVVDSWQETTDSAAREMTNC